MRGIWLEDGALSLRDRLECPKVNRGEALVKVTLAGICNTDLELVRGYYPYTGILGHEFVGTIVEAPSQPSRVGSRVVGEINVVCGACEYCAAGLSNHCAERSVLGIVGRDGAFAEFLRLPLENLIELPPAVSDEAAVFVEPLAAALQIREQVHLKPEHRVLLIGAGKLGQLIGRVLAPVVSELVVVARHSAQVELLEKVGVKVIDEAIIGERSIDVVVEASGSSSGLDLALKAVKPRGTIVLKSTYAGKASLDCSRIVVDEVTLIGSRCGPFRPAIELLAKGVIDPTDMIIGRYGLAQGLEAFKAASERGALKVLLEPGDVRGNM